MGKDSKPEAWDATIVNTCHLHILATQFIESHAPWNSHEKKEANHQGQAACEG